MDPESKNLIGKKGTYVLGITPSDDYWIGQLKKTIKIKLRVPLDFQLLPSQKVTCKGIEGAKSVTCKVKRTGILTIIPVIDQEAKRFKIKITGIKNPTTRVVTTIVEGLLV